MYWYERDFARLLCDESFLRRMRGEYAMAYVNGAGIQERRAEIPIDFLTWLLAFVEAAQCHDGEDLAAA